MIAREHPIDRLRDSEFMRRALNLMREEYHGAFVDLGLVDANGIQVAYAGPFNLQLADYSTAACLRGSPHFIVATQKSEGGQHFVVKATIDFEAFNALVENLRIGSTGFAFIINRGGEFQTNPHFEVALNRAPWIDLLEGRISTDRSKILLEIPLTAGVAIGGAPRLDLTHLPSFAGSRDSRPRC